MYFPEGLENIPFKSDSHRVAHGGPEAPLGGGVSKEPNDIRHFGYQFYSDFSTENKNRVRAHLQISNQVLLNLKGPCNLRSFFCQKSGT
jgi:hypothetical protein